MSVSSNRAGALWRRHRALKSLAQPGAAASRCTNHKRWEVAMDRNTEVLKERAEAQLREWKGRLETWQAKLDQQKLKAEAGSREALASLHRQVDDAREQLKRLQAQGRDTSGELRRRFERVWKDLEDGFEKARKRFER
jgi:hypothetical protein